MHYDLTTRPDFEPPFCPNPECFYHNELRSGWPYKKIGFFTHRASPRRIQRFTCQACGRSFSTQTFSTTYWQKRPDLDSQLFTKATGCMANRQSARDLGVSPPTIDRHLARLGRHCLLLHAMMMRAAKPAARIVVDGFVSFEWSQFFPFHHHLAVEKETDFFLYFTDSEVRRSGTMTPEQKLRREELETQYGRPDPAAVRKDMTELLEVVASGRPGTTIYSDEHKAYPRAIKAAGLMGSHEVTSSRKHRGRSNPLWEVNLLDLLIRHGGANHKRETIAWSKRRQASAERMAIFLVWRNYMNGRREKNRASPTPAMARGMTQKRWTVADVLALRIFPSKVRLPSRWTEYYRRGVRTRPLGKQRRHDLKYAF